MGNFNTLKYMEIVLLILFIIFVICGISFAIYIEKKEFNNGKCPKCGKQLKLFDMDSQGGRGYCCYDCRYYAWISYDCVDKNFKYM